MNNSKYLNRILKIKIDRPLGSKHPNIQSMDLFTL